jgi:prepilin-type N-terminal cleavage/methylation domain-containing protein
VTGDGTAAPSRADGGFTLIEVLVGLTLMVVITTLITESIRQVSRAMSFAERAGQGSAVLLAQNYVRSAIVQAYTTRSSEQLRLKGEKTSLEFVTTYSPESQSQGSHLVSMRLIPSEAKPASYNLVLSQTVFHARPDADDDSAKAPDAPVVQATLLAGVASVAFSYFEPDTAKTGSWVDTWQDQTLPSLIKVEVTFPPGDERDWQPLIALLSSSDQPM